MKVRPILFTAPMVRAYLDGRKGQTRRAVKRENDPSPGLGWADCLCREIDPSDTPCEICTARFGLSPYGGGGDRLWVREAWRVMDIATTRREVQILYEANDERRWVRVEGTSTRTAAEWIAYLVESEERRAEKSGRLHQGRPSIFMPRWASRILHDVTEVRVERVADISEEDAIAEGVEHREHVLASYLDGGVLRGYYEALWDSINAKRPGCSWADNPWVWVITFPRGGGTDE